MLGAVSTGTPRVPAAALSAAAACCSKSVVATLCCLFGPAEVLAQRLTFGHCESVLYVPGLRSKTSNNVLLPCIDCCCPGLPEDSRQAARWPHPGLVIASLLSLKRSVPLAKLLLLLLVVVWPMCHDCGSLCLAKVVPFAPEDVAMLP
jgi:hypothetical protein